MTIPDRAIDLLWGPVKVVKTRASPTGKERSSFAPFRDARANQAWPDSLTRIIIALTIIIGQPHRDLISLDRQNEIEWV